MDEKVLEKILNKQAQDIEKRLDGKNEKRLNEQTKEMQRHQKMLLEEFQSRLKVVAEGHLGIVKILEDHTKILEDHTKKFNALFEMVAMNTETLDFIKSMLKRKVDLDEYEKLEKRVSNLEKKQLLTGI